jgi:hypothetical protein
VRRLLGAGGCSFFVDDSAAGLWQETAHQRLSYFGKSHIFIGQT